MTDRGAASPVASGRDPDWRPRLRPEVELREDRVRGGRIVVQPERLARLNGTAAAILALCDGERTVPAIVDELRAAYPEAPADTLAASADRFLDSALRERWIR